MSSSGTYLGSSRPLLGLVGPAWERTLGWLVGWYIINTWMDGILLGSMLKNSNSTTYRKTYLNEETTTTTTTGKREEGRREREKKHQKISTSFLTLPPTVAYTCYYLNWAGWYAHKKYPVSRSYLTTERVGLDRA